MDKSTIRDRYERILAEQREEHAAVPAGAEQRGAPRVAVVCGDMSVKLRIPVSPVNLSVSGACFHAERPCEIGSLIELSIASVFTIQAIVVDCVIEESSPEFLEVSYRVHCKFVDQEEGLELLLLAKEREDGL